MILAGGRVIFALLGCGAPPAPTVTVLAASSLTEAFTELEVRFEADHPGVDAVLSFAGSQTLATQLRYGLRADVLASADAQHIEALAGEGHVEAPRAFAQNRLVLALSSDVPAGVDLERLDEVEHLVVGAPEVPVGRYTAALLDIAGARYGARWREAVEARVASREANVRLVVAKVAMGEADAAFVYATDVAGVAGVRVVALPAELAPSTSYHHARVTGGPSPALASAWMQLVEGEAGREVLARHGFLVGAP